MINTAILFTTHINNEAITRQILKLRDETKEFGNFYVSYQADKLFMQMPTGVNAFPFTIQELNQLGYTPRGCSLMDGNFHFVLLNFFRNFPVYDYYWLIEYDVRFNGKWKDFFSFFVEKEEDFISAHIETIEDNPQWYWWKELKTVNLYPAPKDLRKSFNPICRFSWRALDLLNRRCKLGDSGHYEVLIPTLFHHYKLKMADFGGHGQYIYKDHPNLFYLSDPNNIDGNNCTHRFRPVYTEEEMKIPNMIYHPIK